APGLLAAGAGPADRPTARRTDRPRPLHRRPGHRGGQLLRGAGRRRRTGAAATVPPAAGAQPVPAELGGAVRRDPGPDDPGRARRPGCRRRPRGGHRQPSVADLDDAALGRAASAVARPAPPRMHPGLADNGPLRRRWVDDRHRVLRTGGAAAAGSERGGRRMKRVFPLVVAGLFALAGCSTVSGTLAEQTRAGDNRGYISGDAEIARYAPSERFVTVTLAGDT